MPGLDLMRAHIAGLRAGAALARGIERDRRYPGIDHVREALRGHETMPEPDAPTVAEPSVEDAPVEPIDPNDVPF